VYEYELLDMTPDYDIYPRVDKSRGEKLKKGGVEFYGEWFG
jgi:hypothetical protein